MKTKIIPFDLETAKKIQAGEIEGRIVTAEGERTRIVCFDRNGFKDSILALITIDDSYEIDMFYTSDGKASKQSRFDIHIELPEETPICNNPNSPRCKVCSNCHCNDCQYNKHEFKPFDKVLVRKNGFDKWKANFFSHMDDGYYKCVNSRYKECVLFEGNEHLVGTTDKPKEN